MQTQETITVTIDPQGNPTVEAAGFTGTSCEDATRAIEQALGAVQQRDLKPEHSQVQVQRQRVSG